MSTTSTTNLSLIKDGGDEPAKNLRTHLNSNLDTIDSAYGTYLNDYEQSLENMAPIESSTASRNYAVGAYLVKDGGLYKVTTAIATGETITPGTNVAATSLNAAVAELNTAVATLRDSVSIDGINSARFYHTNFWAMAMRFDVSATEYYSLGINDGNIALFRSVNGSISQIKSWPESPALLTNVSATNATAGVTVHTVTCYRMGKVVVLTFQLSLASGNDKSNGDALFTIANLPRPIQDIHMTMSNGSTTHRTATITVGSRKVVSGGGMASGINWVSSTVAYLTND